MICLVLPVSPLLLLSLWLRQFCVHVTFTHSYTIYSPIHRHIHHTFMHTSTHQFTHPFTHSVTHSYTYSLTYWYTFIQPFMHTFKQIFIHLRKCGPCEGTAKPHIWCYHVQAKQPLVWPRPITANRYWHPIRHAVSLSIYACLCP